MDGLATGLATCRIEPPVAAQWPLWAAATALLSARWVVGPLLELQRAAGWTDRNWRGQPLPVSLGLGLPVALALGIALASWRAQPWPAGLSGLLGVLCAVLFGLFDDGVRDRDHRGWRNHLRSLRAGTWTSGALKIVGIGAGALLTAAALCPRSGVAGALALLVAGATIAACANVVNLLDTRPGRALKVTLLVALLLAGQEAAAAAWLLPVAATALVFLPLDLGEQAMLGDSGANALGVALGFGLVLAWPQPWQQGVIVVILAIVQAIADRRSLSAWIDSVGPLALLDRLGRPPRRGEGQPTRFENRKR